MSRYAILWLFVNVSVVSCFRYGPVYWVEMSNLKCSHPWLYNQIQGKPGCWTYQRQNNGGFNGMAADQAIETTINKDSKTKGGITGITMNRGRRSYWGRVHEIKNVCPVLYFSMN